MITIAPFDDSQQKDRRRASENQNTSTVELDAYRQGVELTQSKHYAQGMVKIHAGYNGQTGDHTVPQFVYGQTQKSFTDDVFYRDVVPIEPSAYVNESASLTEFVVDRGTDLDVSVDIFDGVMEPFHIRDVVALRREFKAYERKLCAALGEGNVKNREGSDVFFSIVKHKEKKVGAFAMVDVVDTIASLVIVVDSDSVDSRERGPFIEDYTKKGTFSSTRMESDIQVALSAMEPGTENMLPDQYVQLGSTGFFY